MTPFRLLLHVFALMLASSLNAQVQVLLEGGPDGERYVNDMVATSDGDCIVNYRILPGNVHTRFSAAGDTIWSAALIPSPGTPVTPINPSAPSPDGGFYLANALPDPTWGDTLARVDVLKADVNGSVVWSHRIATKDLTGMLGAPTVDLSASQTGELFVLMTSSNWTSVTKLSPTGVPLWSTRTWGPLSFPIHVKATDDGGCVLASKSDELFVTGAGLWRLDANGNMLWGRTVTYDVPGAVSLEPVLALAANGDALLLSRLSTTQNYFMLHRVDMNGDLVWTRLYEFGQGPYGVPLWTTITVTANGNIQLWGTRSGLQESEIRSMMIALDDSGDVLDAWVTLAPIVGSSIHRMEQWHPAVHGDSLFVAGGIREKDLVFGNVVHRESFWSLHGDLTNACFVEDLPVTSLLVPPGIVMVAPGGQSAPSPFVWAMSGMSLSPRSMPTPSSLCMALSTHEREAPGHLSAYPVPVRSGGSMQVEGEGGTVLMLHDAMGRTVDQWALHGSMSTSITINAPSGAYILRLMDRMGHTVRSLPVVVE